MSDRWMKVWIIIVLLLAILIGCQPMPDAPDGFRYQPGSERHVIGDMAELAARLWSPDTYDRRGEVIWMDQFDSGLSNWRETGYDTGDDVILTATWPYRGGYAAKMISAGGDDRMIELHRFLTPPVVNKWGFEVTVAFITDWQTLSIELRRITKSNYYSAWVRLNNLTDKVETLDSNNDVVAVGDLPDVFSTGGLYHHLKIVGDFDNLKQVRILFDHNEYDISAYTMKPITGDFTPMQDVFITYVGRASNTDYCQIGQVIITANEP